MKNALRHLVLLAVTALALQSISVFIINSAATPVADNDATYAVLGRVFPEAYSCVNFVTWNEFQSGIKYLESKFPDMVKVNVLGKSAGGNDVYQVEVTNEKSSVPYEQRKFLFFAGSTHGGERGGAEGQMRVIEDLASGKNPELTKLLDNTIVIFHFLNPDGWIAGDVTQGGAMYERGNANGADLNREWPVVGWIYEQYSPLSEPESIATYSDLTGRVASGQKFCYGSDIHGMYPNIPFVTSDSATEQYLLDVMMPAGQYTFREMYKQVECAKMVYGAAMENLSGDLIGQVNNITGTDVRPSMWGTCWDAIGYTDSGFMGDWITQHEGLNLTGLDFEIQLSHSLAPDNAWIPALEHIHVMLVRIIVENMLRLSTTNPQPCVALPGKVAYIENPDRTQGRDTSENATYYDVCPTDFMRDLDAYCTQPIVPVKVDDIVSGKTKLEDFKAVVIINDTVSNDAKYVEALKNYVSAGGSLVLTDGAAKMLLMLGIVQESDISSDAAYAGYIDIADWSDALVKDVRGIARQTYEPIPLGYSINSNECPVWYVSNASWISKGGKTVGTTGGADRVTLGRIALGKGTVSFIGAVLPSPTEDNDHPYGLSSYAPTYTGYQIMINAIGGSTVLNGTPHAPYMPPAAPPAKKNAFLSGFELSVAVAILAFAAAGKMRKGK